MDSSYINENALINTSINCVNDSSIGYQADFTENGNVDGWEFFDGIHSYGCWEGFLFGTIYDTYGTIGRFDVFLPLDATTHYFIRIVMKYNPYERDTKGIHPLPTQGKIRWRTLSSPIFNSDKEKYFDIYADNKWHTYILNMGVEQYWQGDVNDLRIWPAVENAEDGDEFFIRAIDVFSTESFICRNTQCDKYNEYVHPCPWIGKRAILESDSHGKEAEFDIADGSELIININEYGNEIIKISEINNATGQEIANVLAKAISQTDIGGYAEVFIEYTEDNTFKIYTGTITADSTLELIDNDLSRQLKFFNVLGESSFSFTAGEDPASGYSPLSSFKIKTHQLHSLFDGNEKTGLRFNPFHYSVEGGRRDWLAANLGIMTSNVGTLEADISSQKIREYFKINNAGKTIIDYNHPFNASGRITKIWAQCSLDSDYDRTIQEGDRKSQELSGGKVLIVRPKRDGTMAVIHEFDINDRNPSRTYGDALYSTVQESIEFDVDIFVNKGDLIAVYNANMYTGKTLSGNEYDCRFYQVSGLVSDIFEPGQLYGDGSSGLLVYARGNDTQRRLYIEMDLRDRYNIDNIDMKAEAESTILEYNLARCLDINWQCNLFDEYHWTHHLVIFNPNEYHYKRPNVYYGLENLNDGIYIVPDGLACDSYSLTGDFGPGLTNLNAGPGVVPVNPKYFWVNGDEEWLGIWLHASTSQYQQEVTDFVEDPVAIFVHFPLQKTKKIYKSKIYFKEKENFKSFALSTYGGAYYTSGDADDPHYDLIPEYTKVVLDGKEYFIGGPGYENVDKYLFVNPNQGDAILAATSSISYDWDPVLSDVVEDFGGSHGYFTRQTGVVTNYEQFTQARNLSWNVLEHQWEPIEAQGFRFYCDFHLSTKITEMEIYGVAEDIGSSLVGSIVVNHSYYDDTYFPTEATQESDQLVNIYVGDSPRYLTFEIIPIVETRYDDISIFVKTEDLYIGNKGCEYLNIMEHSKANAVNDSQVINLKNVYGYPYDLYVDIRKETLFEDGLVYYSKLNNALSISNPEVGADGKYYKLFDYDILNQDYNVAINCDVYGLRNLIDGAKAYYSHDDMFTWTEWGELTHGNSIEFNNLPATSKTTIALPLLSRNRYWKFGPLDPYVELSIREMRVYDSDGNRLYPDFYHDLNKTFEEGDVSYRAPHLDNDSVTGSYYTITGDQYITMDFGSQIVPKYLEIFGDGVSDYIDFTVDSLEEQYAGIDKYTKMCLRAWKDDTGSYLNDVSYFEHEASLHGSAHVDIGLDDSNVSVFVDMGCQTDFNGWEENNYQSSTFSGTSASGTVISGSCEYEGSVYFDIACTRNPQSAFYYDIREDSTGSAYKAFHQLPFELTFKIKIDSYQLNSNNYDPSLSVGLFANKNQAGEANWFQGAQMFFDPNYGKFGIAVRRIREVRNFVLQDQPAYDQIHGGTCVTGTLYYCKFSSAGALNSQRDVEDVIYRAEVWTDDYDGSNKVADIILTSDYYWDAWRVGIGGGGLYSRALTYTSQPPARMQGTVYDLKLNIDHNIKHYPFDENEVLEYEKASIRIPDGENNYVKISTDPQLTLDNRPHTHDIWVKFRSLPEIGERFTIMEQYNYTGTDDVQGWRLALYNTGTWYRFEWWVNRGAAYSYAWSLEEYNGQSGSDFYVPNFYIVKDKWYFLMFSTGRTTAGFYRYAFFDINNRGVFDASQVGAPHLMFQIPGLSDIIIGKNFDGWVCEPRISRANEEGSGNHGGHRLKTGPDFGTPWNAPIRPYKKLYTFPFYVSDNNLFYGLYANVDTFRQTNEITYLPEIYNDSDSRFAETYNTYFAIDLGHRYDIDFIRRYGAEDDLFIDNTSNVIFSNVDVDDPAVAFLTEPSYETDDDFEGPEDYLDRDRWTIFDSVIGHEPRYLAIRSARLEHRADSTIPRTGFYSNFGLRGDFDIQINFGKISAPSTFNWWASFKAILSNRTDDDANYVESRIEYRSDTANPYYRARIIFNNGGTEIDRHTPLNSNTSKLRIIREDDVFFMQYFDNGIWNELHSTNMNYLAGKDVYRIEISLECSNNYPTTRIYWNNFKINYADEVVLRSDKEDARWMAIEMLDGDNVDKYLKKIGIYSDITRSIAPDESEHNSEWINLGPSVTNYSEGVNVALDTTVTGSSQITSHIFENIVDGIITDEELDAWLSDNGSEQYVLIDLEDEKEIYRIRIYHGFDTENYPEYYATDYRIETSLNNIDFTTIFDISGNTSLVRTHDLADAVTTRYIRIYITDYNVGPLSVKIQDPDTLEFYDWQGACLKEVEVYEYYGYTYVDSESYPVIAVNLKEQFYISGHELIGPYTENSNLDWDGSDSAFAWSDSVSSNPQHVVFSEYGGSPYYEQWVAIKRDTATYHNIDPPTGQVSAGNQAYGVDYLKHVRIQAQTKENPIYYPWWWSSNICTLSRDYDKEVVLVTSSLRIDYPDSAAFDTVRFIEGSNWGIDSDIAYRDGLSFRWYIEDIDKLNLDSGYFFFGGTDGTLSSRPVVYYWNFSTYSGILTSGWNTPYLRFKDADDVDFNENIDYGAAVFPTMREYTTWHTAGMGFQGKGSAFHMNIDGLVIKRNHFNDGSRFDSGLYLSGPDYMDIPIGGIDFNAGSIEFWLRPDYNGAGQDEFNRHWNRGLFHFGNVSNDVFGCMINNEGINVYFGNVTNEFKILNITDVEFLDIDGMYHIAVVFSNNGENLDSDGSTVKVFINNRLAASAYETWDINDTKLFKFTMGGKPPLAAIESAGTIRVGGCDGVISNLRIYNYCKLDYTDSINNYWPASSSGNLILPSEMIEISSNNLTFYKVDEEGLPLYFPLVPNGTTIPIYVRSIVPKGLSGAEKRTAGIVTMWNVGI